MVNTSEFKTYAETHIDRVLALVLREIFLLRDEEIKWFYQEGASYIFPDMWEKYIEPIPEMERNDLVSAYHRRLIGDNKEERLKCAKAWSTWEMATCRLKVDENKISEAADDDFALAFARIECHYFINKGFFTPNQLLDNVYIIQQSGIPVAIVQGRYDVVCPTKSAWELYKRIPNADFYLVEDCGHSSSEEGISKRLIEATDKYKVILSK
ncbi:hypothetical protein L0F63_003379 [Massospora cicadina]|nr:hypothetical protein L0F63_003379 [Massospora cicadina]